MFLDSDTIGENLRTIHPYFELNINQNHERYFFVPFKDDPHRFIIVNTGINGERKMCSFVEVRLYDSGQDIFFGRKYIVKFIGDWKALLRKTILYIASNLNDFVCDKCGQYLTARKGIHNTYFLGCLNYPECRNTKDLKEIKLSL